MPSFTYDQIVQAMQDWPQNDSAQAGEYVPNIPRIISLGHTRLVRELNLEVFDYVEDLLATQGDRIVAKPDGLIQVRHMRLVDGDGVETPLELRSYSYVTRYAPDPAVEAPPRYYAEYDVDSFIVVPTPDDDYSVRCRFIRRPEEPSASNQLTWLSEKCGDLLFVCCLMEAEHFIKADDRYADMKSKYYEELLPVARLELRRSIRSGDYQPYKGSAKEAS